MYQLICMAPDGEYVTEGRDFPTIKAAWDRANDMGSRWFFYPFCFVTGETGKVIVSAPDELREFVGRRVTTATATFKKVKAVNGLDDCYEFAVAARALLD